ncbi:MAG: VOC family protein [Micromonosporaceae bacterium]
MTSTTVSVSVPVDPATAFAAFTEELDLWWVRGPINYFDSSRAVGMRCEPGVGGRLMEVYDEATGEGLELGRITVWEPGAALAWKSSVDDVRVSVRFVPTAAGTDVTVEATISEGGSDRGGTSWVRVVPKWFPAWCARRDAAPRPQPALGRLGVGLYYERPAAAARWLASAFGLESPDPLPSGPDPLPEGEYGHPWIEFRVGNCSLMVFKLHGPPPEDGPPAPPPQAHETWVFVDDLDTHVARAQAAGAKIVHGIRRTGFRAYTAEDLEGRRWTFAQAPPSS